MTCVIGYVHKGTVYIGADSAGISGYSCTPRKDPKVFINKDVIIGFTSSFRMGQLLQYDLVVPNKPFSTMDPMEYMVTDFVYAVRNCLKNGGYTSIENNQETGGTFLVGFEGRLFRIDSDFQVAESLRNFDAIGCGSDVALGCLYALENFEFSPREKIESALYAVQEFNVGVRWPFNILELSSGHLSPP